MRIAAAALTAILCATTLCTTTLYAQTAATCYAPNASQAASSAPGGASAADPSAMARTADAERSVATQELVGGRVFAAIDRLERLTGPGGGALDPSLSPAVVTLALAYERAGCRAAFLAAAERLRAAQLSVTDAVDMRRMVNRARGAAVDSVDAADVGGVVGVGGVGSAVGATAAPSPSADSTASRAALAAAWARYASGDFAQAAPAFARAADATQGIADRLDIRLMQAQALLQSAPLPSASAQSAALFQSAVDSARGLIAQIDGRVAAGAAANFSRAAVSRRAIGLLWAAGIADGRVVAAPRDSAGAPLRVVESRQVTDALAELGAGAADPVIRALLWTTGDSGLAVARAEYDTLREADARSARAVYRVESTQSARPDALAAAARYVATLRTMNDSLVKSETELRSFETRVTVRDSAIARAIAEFRAPIDLKIKTTREMAAQNRARADSIAPAARAMGELTTRFLVAEQGTALEYGAVADAAAVSLEQRLAHLAVVVKRDTVHAKRTRFSESIRDGRAAYDAALSAALAAERERAAAADADIAAARAEQRAADLHRDSVVSRATVAVTAALVGRTTELKQRLGRVIRAGGYGNGAALFFVAIEGDTLRANGAEVTRRRDAALAVLSDAVTADSKSPLVPSALLQLGELLTRKADAEFAAAQRGGTLAPAATNATTAPGTAKGLPARGAIGTFERPEYGAAIARFDELLKSFPNDPRADVAAYTLGTLAFVSQRYDDAARAFQVVMTKEGSRFRAEAFFRNGDGRFEQASKLAALPRHTAFADAAASYDRAIALAPVGGDIYFLALYKLGWSNYMQAERQSSDEYRRAVDIFARLVREVDSLPPERQARLALRQEAIDYLAIAITQLGGAEEAVKYLGSIPDVGTRMLVLRRVAHALRDQGEFNNAVITFRGALEQAPTHAAVLETRVELVDLFQSRMLEPSRAQEARLELVAGLAPASTWGSANAARAGEAAVAREKALREAGGFALSEARRGLPVAQARAGRRAAAASGTASGAALAPIIATSTESQARHAAAAELFSQYFAEFSGADSAQRVSLLEGDARFGARDWFASGVAYSRTATKWIGTTLAAGNPGNPGNPVDPNNPTSAVSAAARSNSVVAFDSALAAERRSITRDPSRLRMIEDSLFTATERFVAAASPDDAKAALVAMGRRASEAQRWDVVVDVFARVADRWATDAFAPDARKFVGDARYKQGRYADAQTEWRRAQAVATQGNRKAFADSIVGARIAAASQAADSLARRGEYVAAADSVLTAMAADISDPARAADLLRNAIEVHLTADSTERAGGDAAASRTSRVRAIAAVETLSGRFPSYQHTLTYMALRARLLSDVGRAADAAAALELLAARNPAWPGRADAMVRAAVILDSIGQPEAAAAAYERFSAAYPADKRAADAQFNAAVILRDAKDAGAAARAFQTFAARFPRDPRVGDALVGRVTALRASGDSATVGPELARLCARPAGAPAVPAALGPTCADRAGWVAFRDGMARWDAYAALTLEIKTRAQLTRDGVALASAPKLQALRALTQAFTRAIASGAPEWVAAGSFQTGLAQWQYGLFLRDVSLPGDITDAQREGAQNGSAGQAQQYFDSAIKTWTALVEKAANDKFENAWVEKARGALRGEGVSPRVRSAP